MKFKFKNKVRIVGDHQFYTGCEGEIQDYSPRVLYSLEVIRPVTYAVRLVEGHILTDTIVWFGEDELEKIG